MRKLKLYIETSAWNFSHMANLRKNELFNGINLEKGYTKRIELITPMEVAGNEDR